LPKKTEQKTTPELKPKRVLLMTTAPPEKDTWYHGKRLPPIGLMYIASALEKAGYNVQMLDNYLQNKSIEEVKTLVATFAPSLIGITCGSATYKRCVETAAAIKEAKPDCAIVVGGWHASYLPDTLLSHSEIDYVVMGEGERAITQLADALIVGDLKAASAVAGVACRGPEGNKHNAPVFIENMDEIPYPARHLLPMEQYNRIVEFLTAKPADIMSISRGCVFSCGFCETRKLWGNICRGFSPQRVIGEIEDLQKRFGTKGIYFINDNFTLRKERTKELCRLMIQKNLGLEWVCDTRVDLIDDELLELMSQAGCKVIWFGVESGSPKVLKSIGRNTTPEQVEEAFKLCKKHDIRTACSFMIGLPGETIADMEESLKFAKKINPDYCQFNIFIAYPDSRLYNEMLQSGNYTQLDDYLLSVKTDEYDFESLKAVQWRFFKSFHLAPKQILKRAKREGLLNFAKSRLVHGTKKASGMA
jgi:anaerobic magnesium-protoporphyrin IX monomethyl ester cyclase